MRLRPVFLAVLILCPLLYPAHSRLEAQVVSSVLLDWREQAFQCSDGEGDYVVAMHVAMFQAVNAVTRKYEPYREPLAAPPGSSPLAAAAAAAHEVLATSCSGNKGAFDAALDKSLAEVADSVARARGEQVGREAARQVLQSRQDAVPMREAPFMTGEPGAYVPTMRRWGLQQASRRPWIMTTASELRPPAPPPLESETWARDFDELRRMGGRKSEERTAVQTDIARLWSMDGPMLVVRQLIGLPRRSLVDDARLVALLEMANSDSYTSMMDAKYAYNFWRPVTAIRGAAADANAATVPDSTWEPLIATPAHPEYPCGHCLSAGAVGAILEAEFGENMPALVLDREKVMLRRWLTARALVDEVSEARLLGGVHYRFSVDAGRDAGLALGRLAVQRHMRPAPTALRRSPSP